MGDSTPIFGLRFPVGSDSPPDVPTDMGNLAQDVEDQLAAGIRSAGKAIIDASQSTTSSSFVYLGTPDRVQNIILPSEGLIFVAFEGNFACTGGGTAGQAAIFLNGVQAKIGGSTSISGQQAVTVGTGNNHLFSSGEGLKAIDLPDGYPDPVTGGQILGHTGKDGGVCALFADAGTYEVGIKFRAASGTLTALNRKLWVWSMGSGLPA